MSSPYYYPQPPAPVCYRHPDRPTWVSCTRCGRPTCPECMYSAPVGHQCADCVRAGAQIVARPAATRAARPSMTTAPVTYGLIVANVLVFILMAVRPELRGQFSLWSPAVAAGEYYRLITSAFMHNGLVHIAFNMFALYVLGPPLEAYLGRLRFSVLYGLSALGGSVLVYLLSPLNASTVGASGAIFGLFGATFVAARKLQLDMRGLIAVIVFNLAITFTLPGISWQGHVGGLITGALVAAAYFYAPAPRRTAIQVGASIGVLVVLVLLIAWRTSELVQRFGEMLGH